MNDQSNNTKKITFRYYSDVLEEDVVETMWSEELESEEGIYRLENIPFYGPLIAPGDIFHAEYNEDLKELVFTEVVESSGNSVVQIIMMNENYDKAELRNELKELGCESEGVNDNFFVVEIPESINYLTIKENLDSKEKDELISYAEPVLSVKHQDDIAIIDN